MGTFRLIQFNMQHGQMWNASNPDLAPIRIQETAKTLGLYDADILMLQEVEKARPGGEQANPPANFSYLKSVLKGYHSVFAYPPKDKRELPFGLGLAIFSRFHILRSETVILPGAEVEFEFQGEKTTPTDRILLSAEIEIEGKLITFLNTHLQAYFMINASSDDYLEQRNLVLETVKSIDGPLILTGDFNSGPGEGLVAQFENTGLRTMQKETVTWKRMPYVLDHIFYNPQIILKGGTVDEVSASDHHMLVAEFQY
ncbi:MAG: endonuclease/exonuclease/phosphatase family protein [Verrucomicrobia bacterium]|nr:endonuclease/exonuclease/phosphatase family protein [Verrucomicrobiota bacterium]